MKRVLGFIITLCSSLVFIVTLPAPSLGSASIQAPRVNLRDGISINWSGYAVESNLASPQSNVITDVKGTWTIPTAFCTSLATSASFWVGIDGYDPSISTTVEQTGTGADCTNGKATYYAWYEMYPRNSVLIRSFAVNPGDVINAEVRYDGNDRFTLIVNNASTGGQFSITQNGGNAVRDSAEWIAEAPSRGNIMPLTDFGNVSFRNASVTVKGISGTIAAAYWQHESLTMMMSSGVVKAAISDLGSGANSFSVTWKRS